MPVPESFKINICISGQNLILDYLKQFYLNKALSVCISNSFLKAFSVQRLKFLKIEDGYPYEQRQLGSARHQMYSLFCS